jgi:hypothetical protein
VLQEVLSCVSKKRHYTGEIQEAQDTGAGHRHECSSSRGVRGDDFVTNPLRKEETSFRGLRLALDTRGKACVQLVQGPIHTPDRSERTDEQEDSLRSQTQH